MLAPRVIYLCWGRGESLAFKARLIVDRGVLGLKSVSTVSRGFSVPIETYFVCLYRMIVAIRSFRFDCVR